MFFTSGNTMNRIHLITDYTSGDLAQAEVIDTLLDHMPAEWTIHDSSVTAFDTISIGFMVAQLGNRPVAGDTRRIVYANSAPRRDRSAARSDNEGEELYYARLISGCEVLVVNSGYSLSFIRDTIKELRSLAISKGGSQFRSRDIFPVAVGAIANNDYALLDSTLDPLKVIPEIPEQVIAYIDNFGNLKTTLRGSSKQMEKLSAGQRVTVKIHGRPLTATVVTGNFNVPEGD